MTKILVVDDNASSRNVVLKLLKHEGYDAVEAIDGADGLRVARMERPDLVISDILMPSMDGYEFVRQLRSSADLATTAVIFYTANYHSREAENLARQCGVSRVIVKPCGARDFLRSIAEVLGGAAAPGVTRIDESFDREHLQVITNKLSRKADQLAALNGRLAAVNELNVQLAAERDPATLFKRVCSGARSLLGAKYALVAVRDPLDSSPAETWSSGIELSEAVLKEISLDAGAAGQAYRSGAPVRISGSQDFSLDAGLPSQLPPANSVLAVPITSGTTVSGCLCLVDKLGAPDFDVTDERMLSTLGALVGRIYDNMRLYGEVQKQAAQLLVEVEERERAVAGLRDSEERFRQIAEYIEDVFIITEPDLSRTIYISPAYERVWGRPASDLDHAPGSWILTLHPDDRERVSQAHDEATRKWPAQAVIEYRIVRPDGEVRWIFERLFPIVSDTREVIRAVGVCTDITERKKAESRIVQLSRVHAMLSGINSLIVRVRDRDELFGEACRLAVAEGGFRFAWCALLDSATGRLSLLTSHGELEGWSDVAIAEMVTAADENVVTTALRTGKAQVSNDPREGGLPPELAEVLARAGCRGIAVLPLLMGDRVAGCIALLTGSGGQFDVEEMRLLTELAGDVSFALDHIEKAERLSYLAFYDSLTGLANRTFFAERLATYCGAAVRNNGRFAVVAVGLERFEGVSDALGRTAADELFRRLAEGFVRCVGQADLVARLGSDQLAAVVPDIESDYSVESTLEHWWREWPGAPIEINGQPIASVAKAGVALFPGDGMDADALLRNAQTALKKAHNSSARDVFYTTSLSERLTERLSLESQMRRAIHDQEFVLHYQPKVDVERRQLTGVEALMRWQHPQLGLVPPAKFIPIMEENGLIIEMGRWAMRQACHDRARWLALHLKAPRIAVNVSAVQLRQQDFVATMSAVLADAGADHGLDIEVTESLLMEDVAENIQKLAAIRELGVQIALDDFGTGYSSLAYLAKLPVEALKIDRSFVIAMLDDPGATALVSTILSLARALKLRTVAEGVESEEQAKILRLLQCDQMQGYLISKPLDFRQMTDFLERARN